MNRTWLRIYGAVIAMAAGSTTLLWALGRGSVRCGSFLFLPVLPQAVLVFFGLLVLQTPAYRDPSRGVAPARVAKALLIVLLLLMLDALVYVQWRGFLLLQPRNVD